MNTNKPSTLQIGQILERAPALQVYQAFLNSFYWDKNNGGTPSGIMTIGETRKTPAKNNFPERKDYPKIRIRVWGSNAFLASDLYQWMLAEEVSKGRKPAVFLHTEVQWNSYEKPNGNEGENGKKLTDTVILHNGRKLIYLNNAIERKIDIIGADYVSNNAEQQA